MFSMCYRCVLLCAAPVCRTFFRSPCTKTYIRFSNFIHLSAYNNRIETGIRMERTSYASSRHLTEASLLHQMPFTDLRKLGCRVDMQKKVFCNRSLNMKSIVAVGFDMDYTLAQYKPETFETLAYNGTIKKLVYDLCYPKEILNWKFDWTYMIRGLVVDKKRGNILKMDRHKYVKVAYHGLKEMTRENRIATYGNTLARESFDEPDYALIDTLFSLAEAYLFAQLVEFKDTFPDKLAAEINYIQIYKDVRAAIDLCHRDGTLKQAVASNPSKFIHDDHMVVPMLKLLRSSQRMTFLVTNSLWDYTNVVMNYLFGKGGAKGTAPRDYEWLDYFDVVITGSTKPHFFNDEEKAQIFEVDINSGMLKNTDNGTPMAQIGDGGLASDVSLSLNAKQGCRVFQGGNVSHLHQLLGIEAGSQVLYVGDHIYGDILRSKKQLGWRTMLVVPELEKELVLLSQLKDTYKELQMLRKQRNCLEDKLEWLKWDLKFKRSNDNNSHEEFSEVERLEEEMKKTREFLRNSQQEFHQKFHKIWGQLMKTGYQNSRFAHQVERFACLYTSQVTNLCYYSPDICFRTSEDFMPHDFDSVEI